MDMETKRYYGKCLDYQISEVKEFKGVKNYTGVKFKLLTFGLVEDLNGNMVTLEALRLKRNDYTIYVNGENQGSYMKPDVLRTVFTHDKSLQIQATIRDADCYITNQENIPVYVSRREYDDPEYMKHQEFLQNYWRMHEIEYLNQLSNLNTDIAYYKEVIKDNTTILQKYRISRIMKTAVNIDLSEATIDSTTGELLLPESYKKTIKVKIDDLATWLWFNCELTAESYNKPNHSAFIKTI